MFSLFGSFGKFGKKHEVLGALWQKSFCFNYFTSLDNLCKLTIFLFLIVNTGSGLSAIVRAVSYTRMLFCILTLCVCVRARARCRTSMLNGRGLQSQDHSSFTAV